MKTPDEHLTQLSVLTPYSVAVHCPCGLKPEAQIDVMSLTAHCSVVCACGRSFTMRSGLGGVTVKESP